MFTTENSAFTAADLPADPRRRGVAIVFVDDEEGSRAWRLYLDKQDARARARLTRAQLFTIAYTFDNAFDLAARKWFGKMAPGLASYGVGHMIAEALAPSYTDLRDYLAYEIECHYRDACVVAFAVVVGRTVGINPAYQSAERGWL